MKTLRCAISGTLGREEPPGIQEAVRCAAANVPERDANILREYRAGRSPSEIATLLRIRREDVAWSLARSYAGMRVSN